MEKDITHTHTNKHTHTHTHTQTHSHTLFCIKHKITLEQDWFGSAFWTELSQQNPTIHRFLYDKRPLNVVVHLEPRIFLQNLKLVDNFLVYSHQAGYFWGAEHIL